MESTTTRSEVARQLTVPEVAQRLRCSIDTVRRAIHRRELSASRVFGRFRISEAEVERLLAERIEQETG